MSDIKCRRCLDDGVAMLVLTPELMHYGKYICQRCNTFIQWAKNPNPTHEHLMTGLTTDDPIIQFGKNKGVHLSDVPLGYLRWMYDGDFPSAIIQAVAGELKRRGIS